MKAEWLHEQLLGGGGFSGCPPLSDSVVLSTFPSLSLFPHLSDGATAALASYWLLGG